MPPLPSTVTGRPWRRGGPHRMPALSGGGTDPVLDVGQGGRPVDFGFACAKQIQVRAIEEQQALLSHIRSAATRTAR